ncbi:ferredoxin reductase domain-containing protein [Rothia uropygialis]|uniref:hypothetical protein n=1 Tax=Kocuria sp. 36 TaxID=1415402 RepID=UPI00193106A9|nr:hypothetical protein [Kocuria sp. 36]
MVALLIWLHVHVLTRMNQFAGFMILFDLYTVAVLAVYVWKKWVAPGAFLQGTVVANEAHGASPRMVPIELDRENPSGRAGDFFFLSLQGTSAVSRERHPFSVTDDDQGTLTFTIRQHGDWTTRLGDVAAGTRARLEGPFGRFDAAVAAHAADAPLVLIGMGAGVAPLLSLAAAHHPRRRIHLLWSVRTPDDLYYRDLLDQYRAASGGKMQVTTSVGRFRRADLEQELTNEELRTGAFFIVGSSPAVLAYQRLLRRMGVTRRRIHQERLM